MKTLHLAWISTCALTTVAFAQFEGFVNKGLVGVGRLPADLFDKAGDGRQDTLGGVFSAMEFDSSTLRKTSDGSGGFVYSGTLYGVPDRGFGDGATDYHPRVQVFGFSIKPHEGPGPAPQNQISFTNISTLLLTSGGTLFTGFDAGETNRPAFPLSPTNSVGQGKRSLDAEGIARMPDGSFFLSDEYGPLIYRFNATGDLLETLYPPTALLPKVGNYPGAANFNGVTAPTSGRRNNRGLEGLTLIPGGKRLGAMLQSPTIQDGGAGNFGRNTRFLQFDVDPASPTYGRAVTEHVYTLTLNGTAQTNRHTPISEVLAVSSQVFMALERDSLGLGVGTNTASTFKRVVLFSTEGATNIINSAYDLERGAPGQISLPAGSLPSSLQAVRRFDFVDLLDPVQLARFGLNASTNYDANTLSEKWEGLTVIPMNDPAAPNDYLLLVGNDNDFKAPVVYHNGQVVGTNDVPVDIMILAYRVTLPGFGKVTATAAEPSVVLGSPATAVYAAGPMTLGATGYDADGRISKVEFFEDGALLGQLADFPFSLTITNPVVGTHVYRVRVTDNDGRTSETSRTIQVTAGNLAPAVSIRPLAQAVMNAPANVALVPDAGDSDGFIRQVEYLRNGTRFGVVTSAPFSLTATNLPLGDSTFIAIATDNLGLSTTSAPVALKVQMAVSQPLTLQILHASDFEAGIAALDDAPRFSSVLQGLRSEFLTNTIFLASGDNYIPGPFFTASADPAAPFNGVKGRADITILNAMGLQASCFGNHEFDDNTAAVRSLILADAAAGYAGTRFPYLSANLNFATDSSMASLVSGDRLNASSLSNKVARSAVVSVAGQLIGLVGGTTVDLRSISSPGSIGVSTNLVSDIQAAVDALLADGINKVVVMTHLQQFANEFALAAQLRNVDVIIGGGSHSVFAKAGDRLRAGDFSVSEYPTTVNDADGRPVLVVNTGSNYRYVGRLVVNFDESGAVIAVDRQRSGAYATDVEGVLASGNLAPNPVVLNVVSNLASIVDGKDGNRFGKTAVYLNGLRNSVRTEQSNLGDLSAEANLFRARLTDPLAVISLKNGGGIRDSIGAIESSAGSTSVRFIPPPANPRVGKQSGDISQLDIENALRFNNGLSIVTLTAQQLRDTMEWAVAGSGTPGQFPQVAGIEFSFVPTNTPMVYTRNSSNIITGIATPGTRLRNLVVIGADESQDLVVENGLLVGNPNRTFRVVTLDFMASGGDNYWPLTQGTGRQDLAPATGRTFNTDGCEQRAMADYMAFIKVFTESDTPASLDTRIQNLSRRSDVVLAPLVRQITGPNPAAQIIFRTLPGKTYEVESKDSIDAPWEKIGLRTGGTGALRQLVDARPGAAHRYYRVLMTN